MKEFTKNGLQVNDIVTTRAGNTYTVHDFNGKLFAIREQGYLAFDDYNNDLTLKQGAGFDIVKVQRPDEAYQLTGRAWVDVPVIWKRKEKDEVPLLSEAEYHILKNLNTKWKWIARDGYVEGLWLFREKAKKRKEMSDWIGTEGLHFNMYNHLFPYVQLKDDEPWKIGELLKRYENSQGEKQWNRR